MTYSVYAIRDKYTGFMMPTVDMNDDSGKRNFGYGINNNPSLNYSPADFDFYRIGTYDSKTGEIRPVQPIEFICNGLEVFNEKSQS